jgi:branched-chain amino acid transport system permease protein
MPDFALRTLGDQLINGLVIGNIYALIAIGLALIFGVANLINFAHGSVYMVGAYVGWVAITWLGWPLLPTFVLVAVVCAGLGLAIERFGLRQLQNQARIAPLLATIGISFALDQLVQIVFSPNPHAFPSPLPATRIALGGVSVGLLDLLIAGITIAAAAALFAFLRFTRLGWAVRATAQDREAAQQMGVDVDAINALTFAIASVLGGIGGMLIGMYFTSVYPTMSYGAMIKGFVANLIGGLGNVPGAVVGGLLLGLIETFGVALLGSTYRNLFAFVILLGVLVVRPTGLFGARRALPPEPLTGTFVPSSQPVRLPPWLVAAALIAAVLLPFISTDPYLLQIFTSAWLFAMLALSITLVTGVAGQISLGQAGFLAIGGYASALLSMRLGLPVELSLILGAILAAAVGTLLTWPVFRLRSQYVALATLGVGEVINQIVLTWEDLTNGPLGLSNIPPLSFFGLPITQNAPIYWAALALLVVSALFQWRLMRSHLGRTWRALRDDEVAARAFGIVPNRYKALAFIAGGLVAGLSGAFTAHMYSYINNETFAATTSILGLTMVILGGMGNMAGAVVGAVALTALPELFRPLADARYLIYGLVLLLLVRFRPQGMLGTV